MVKPVDKVRQIRYNFLWYFNLLVIIYYTTDGRLFGVCFSVFRHKNGAIAPVAIVQLLLQQPHLLLSVPEITREDMTKDITERVRKAQDKVLEH